MRHRSLALFLASLLFVACKGLAPPLAVGHDTSLVGNGIVLTLTNTSDEHLHEIAVEIEAPDGETKRVVFPTLEPHESTRLGWLRLDGWPIPEGAKVKIRVRDYVLPVRHAT